MASAKSIAGLAVTVILIGVLLPIAMTEIIGANTTGWSTAQTTIFQTVIPILCIIGLALAFLPRGKKGSSRSVVNMAVGLLLIAILVPIGILVLVNENTTTWPTATGTVFGTVLPILILIGLALKFLPRGKGEVPHEDKQRHNAQRIMS